MTARGSKMRETFQTSSARRLPFVPAITRSVLVRLRPRGVIAAAALAVVASACAPAGAGPPTAAAVVNGEEIPIEQLSSQFEAAKGNPQISQQLEGDESGELSSQLQARILTDLIRSRLLEEGARRELGVEVSSEDVAQQREEVVSQVGGEEAFKQLLEQNNVTEEQVRQQLRTLALQEAVGQELTAEGGLDRDALEAAYEQQYVEGNPIASHILVETEEKAEQILQRLEEGADFGKLAKEESQDPTAERNAGELGEIAPGQTVPAFEEALFDAEPGEVVGPVETEFGYHVIKREKPPLLREVEDELRDQAQEQQRGTLVQQFVVEQGQNAEVTVNPRFGQWDAEAAEVVPGDPLGPPEGGDADRGAGGQSSGQSGGS